MIGYLGGYRGLLKGEWVSESAAVRAGAAFHDMAAADGTARKAHQRRRCGEARAGEGRALPPQVAAEQLTKDGVAISTRSAATILATAADLAKYSGQRL
jgi:hypothetical protein